MLDSITEWLSPGRNAPANIKVIISKDSNRFQQVITVTEKEINDVRKTLRKTKPRDPNDYPRDENGFSAELKKAYEARVEKSVEPVSTQNDNGGIMSGLFKLFGY